MIALFSLILSNLLQIIEIITPLTTGAMTKVGPGTSPVEGGEVKDESKNGVLSVKLDIAKVNALLEFCQEAKSRTELQEFCKIRSQDYFRRRYSI